MSCAFGENLACICPAQVSGFWQWALYVRRRAESHGRQVVYINIDESSILQACPPRRGICLRRRYWPSRRLPTGPAAKNRRRGAISLVAMVSSKHSLQRHLPQIFIGNMNALPRKSIQHIPEGNVKFWRKRSSWVNTEVMVNILKELAQVLPRSGSTQYVLVLDCCAVHLSELVLTECRRQSWWLLYVPPHCTRLLQPLDCSVFGAWKESFRKGYRCMKARNPNGSVSLREWVDLLLDVTQKKLCDRSWTDSFYETGLMGSGARLSADLQHLQLPYPSEVCVPSAVGLLPQGREALLPCLLDCQRQPRLLS